MRERFKIYAEAEKDAKKAWGRGAYVDDNGNHCLGGNITQAIEGRVSSYQSPLLPDDICDEIDAELSQYASYRILRELSRRAYARGQWYPANPAANYKQAAIETWNDVPWRRRKAVIRVFSALKTQTEVEWLRSERARLMALVEQYDQTQVELKAEIEALQAENKFWRNIVKGRSLKQKQASLEAIGISMSSTQHDLEQLEKVSKTYGL